VLIAFAVVVLVGGTNFVAVRFSNRELPPFFGAGIRFVAAGALLLAYALATRVRLPSGGALAGALVFGALQFVAYALAYWALLGAPAALASAMTASVPLLTLFFAAAIGLERLTTRGVIGGLIAVAGVFIVFADQLSAAVSVGAFVALVAQAAVIAASTVLVKKIPRAHPIASNAIAMPVAALLLLLLAAFAREAAVLPTRPEVWTALVYLVLSTIALFVGIFFVISHWTASASSYATVLFPIVTVAVGAALAGETVSLAFLTGAALVMLGTYVGSLAASAAGAPRAPRASSASRP
jgi:drug/metabolite transporter (DMT)-like permease